MLTKSHNSIKSLNHSLQCQWNRILVEELRRVAENFTKHLKLCIDTKGHFESS